EQVLSAGFEDGEASINLHLRAIGQGLAQRNHGATKDDAGNGGPGIFEGKILVSRRMLFVIRDFALDPNISDTRFEEGTDGACQLSDGKYPGRFAEEIARHRDCVAAVSTSL